MYPTQVGRKRRKWNEIMYNFLRSVGAQASKARSPMYHLPLMARCNRTAKNEEDRLSTNITRL